MLPPSKLERRGYDMASLPIVQTSKQIDVHHCLMLGKDFGNKHLTKRETEVLKYVVLGYTAKKIEQSLQISFRTVEAYIEILKMKLDCESKSDITEKIIKSGLICELGLF